jgi:hypothetical protein
MTSDKFLFPGLMAYFDNAPLISGDYSLAQSVPKKGIQTNADSISDVLDLHSWQKHTKIINNFCVSAI